MSTRTSRNAMRSLKRRKRIEFRVIAVTLAALMLVVSFGTYKLKQKNIAYKQQEAELQAEIAEEEERVEELEELAVYVQTMKYVEEVAKEKLGLVYEDEILFKAVE